MASLAGIVLLTRHGDRQGFYQDPVKYTAKLTNLTVLGYLQEYQNGVDLRQAYLSGSQPIQGIDAQVAQDTQLSVIADAGGEGSVIVDSANALLQGFYPPFNESIVLANGSTVAWDNRAQLIQIGTHEGDQAIDLEGWTECDAWSDSLDEWYDSADFKAVSQGANAFYTSIQPLLGNRPANLENAWNLFDFINVESIHNTTLSPSLSPLVAQARYYADYHEAGAFSDSDPSSIKNIAGQSILPLLLNGIDQVANASNPLKVQYLSASYKPFLSLFNMMGLPAPLSTSVVDYASAAVWEVYTDSTVKLRFRNGTQGEFQSYPLLGSDSTSISAFKSHLQPYALSTRADWCNKCGTTDARGCDVLAKYNGTGGAGYASDTTTLGRHRVSPVVGGVIGAMVTLAVVAVALALWNLLAPRRRQRQAAAVPVDGAYKPSTNSHELLRRTGSEATSRHESAASHYGESAIKASMDP